MKDNFLFVVSDIQWELDPEDKGESLDLPSEVRIVKELLLHPGETEGDVDTDELQDRIADHLSDTYGYLVRGFAIDEVAV